MRSSVCARAGAPARFGVVAALLTMLAAGAASAQTAPNATANAYAAALVAGYQGAAAAAPAVSSQPAAASGVATPTPRRTAVREAPPPKPTDTLWPWNS